MDVQDKQQSEQSGGEAPGGMPEEEHIPEVRHYTSGHSGVRAAEGTEFAGQDVFDSVSLLRVAAPVADTEWSEAQIKGVVGCPSKSPAIEIAPDTAPHENTSETPISLSDIKSVMQDMTAAIRSMAGAFSSTSAAPQAAPAPTPQPQANMMAFSGKTSVAMGVQKELDMGPLAPLIRDESVNDILINGPYDIYIERGGKIERTDIVFDDHQTLYDLAQKIVGAVGRRLDPKRPLVDARLLDGSRVNIVAPPLAIDGISMSIRKFSRDRITLDRMADMGNITPQLAAFLKVAGRAKVNMVICGGTGSGKTTMLNAISQHISADERIVTIEDSAELQLQQPHVVRLETKEPETYGDKQEEVSMRDLVKNALRMRPDRIIVGEVRGPEAFDMIQAMNTGHDGSLTTIHANTPRDGMARIENMVSMANLNIPMIAIRKQIASAVHLIVQTQRMEDGVRRVTEIAEVVGMEGEVATMQEIFKYKSQGIGPDGKLKGQQVWSQVFPRHTALTTMLREAGVFKL